MITTVKFDLPAAGEWADGENMAVNLRSGRGVGSPSVPAGVPAVMTANAGAACEVMASGSVLTVGADMLSLSLDGEDAGRLGAPFLSLLPEGDGNEALIFTSAGAEWFAEGSCQGSAPADLDVNIESEEAGATFSATVLCPDLKGPYSRLSGELTADDRRRAATAVGDALSAIEAQARGRGLFVGPCRVGWRLVDAAGRTIAAGAPQTVGPLPALPTLHFTATKSGTVFSVDTTDTLSLAGRRLRLTAGRSASEFWRRRGVRIEVGVIPDCMELSGVTGRLDQLGSTTSTLSLTPVVVAAEGVVAALGSTVQNPLDGVDAVLAPAAGTACPEAGAARVGSLVAGVAFRSGSLTAYALEGRTGVMAVASSADPLALRTEARVCRGRIVRICAPAGMSGGWNYGRHHLLVFATDGIYAVSVDGRLQTVSSACVCDGAGISRPDAVVASPSALYVATTAGRLLRLRGARAERVDVPCEAVALGRDDARDELWIPGRDGRIFVLDGRGRLSMRSTVAVRRFVGGGGFAVDTADALRDLGREEAAEVAVGWCRRFVAPAAGGRARRVEWRLDSAGVTNLDLSLSVDSGGGRQRVVALRVNGAVNAPVSADLRLARRPWLTAQLGGVVAPATRLGEFRLISD